MRWELISIGVALIVAITFISCYMVYENENVVWWLYGILVFYLVFCGHLIVKDIRTKSKENDMIDQQKRYESLYVSNLSTLIKEKLVLQNELDEVMKELKNKK